MNFEQRIKMNPKVIVAAFNTNDMLVCCKYSTNESYSLESYIVRNQKLCGSFETQKDNFSLEVQWQQDKKHEFPLSDIDVEFYRIKRFELFSIFLPNKASSSPFLF